MFSFDFAASQRGQWRGAPRPLQETPPRKGCDHFHSIATRFACYDFFVIQLNVIIFKDFKSVNFFFPIFASNFFFVRKLSTHRCVSTDRMIFTCRTHRAPLEKVPIFFKLKKLDLIQFCRRWSRRTRKWHGDTGLFFDSTKGRGVCCFCFWHTLWTLPGSKWRPHLLHSARWPFLLLDDWVAKSKGKARAATCKSDYPIAHLKT